MSLGVDADGKRVRRRVTAATKTAVLEAMAELREELGRAPRASRKYTVNEAVAEWLEGVCRVDLSVRRRPTRRPSHRS